MGGLPPRVSELSGGTSFVAGPVHAVLPEGPAVDSGVVCGARCALRQGAGPQAHDGPGRHHGREKIDAQVSYHVRVRPGHGRIGGALGRPWGSSRNLLLSSLLAV